MSQEEFSKLWEFESGQEICIKHAKKDGFLQCKGEDGHKANFQGDLGKGKTIFNVTINEDGTVEFESEKSDKYLRLDKDGNGWRCDGKEDKKNSTFIMEKYGPGQAIIRCEKEVDGSQPVLGAPDDNPLPVTIYTRGEAQEKFNTQFSKPECEGKTVVIKSCLHLTTIKARKDDVSCEGRHGPPCQWRIKIDKDGEYQFVNEKQDACLAMKKDGTIVLEDRKGKEKCDFEIIPIFEHDKFEHLVYIKSCQSDKYLGYESEPGKPDVKPYDEPNEFCRWALYFE